MKSKGRVLLILVAVASFGIALSYPIRYRMEAQSSDNTLEQLTALRNAGLAMVETTEVEPEVDPGAEPPEATEGEAKAPEATTEQAAETLPENQEPVAERDEVAPANEEPTEEFSEATQDHIPAADDADAAGLEAPEAESKPASISSGAAGDPVAEGEAATQTEAPAVTDTQAQSGKLMGLPIGQVAQSQSEETAQSETEAQPEAAAQSETEAEPEAEGQSETAQSEDGQVAVNTPASTQAPTPSPEPTSTPEPTPTINRFARSNYAAPYPEKTKVELDVDKILPQYREIYSMNPDFVGWITIPGMNVDYPMVQTENSEFYLEHDFFGEKNANGQIILDTNCDPYTPSYNLVISGHNMKSGKMFGNLVNFMYKSYWEKHMTMQVDTLMESKQYVIFACFFSADYDVDEEGFRYNADLQYAQDVKQWLKEIKENEVYDTGIDVRFGDEFVTLTTCNKSRRKDGRFVLVARRIRPGERY